MARPMTSAERFRCTFDHKEPDRLPIFDSPWNSTWQRWRQEGYPEGADPAEFFGWDRVAGIHIDNSPRYPVGVVEETDEYKIHTTAWGTTQKNWKSKGGVPEFEALHHHRPRLLARGEEAHDPRPQPHRLGQTQGPVPEVERARGVDRGGRLVRLRRLRQSGSSATSGC